MKTKLFSLYFLTLLCQFKTLLAPEFEIDQAELEKQIDYFYQNHFDDLGSNKYKLFKLLVTESLNPKKENIEINFDKNPEFKTLLEPHAKPYLSNIELPPCPFNKICGFYEYDYYKNKTLLPYILLFLVTHYPFLQNPFYKENVITKFYFTLISRFEKVEILFYKKIIKLASDLLFENSFKLGIKVRGEVETSLHYDNTHNYYIEILKLIYPEERQDDFEVFWRNNFNQIIFNKKTSLEEVKHYWHYLPCSSPFKKSIDQDGSYIMGLIKIITFNLTTPPEEIYLQDPVVIPNYSVQGKILEIIDSSDRTEQIKELLETKDKEGFCTIHPGPGWDTKKIDAKILRIMLKAFKKIESL